MIFDTHCHLGYTEEPPEATLTRAREAGVSKLLTVGIDLASSRRASELATPVPGLFHSVGLHPNSASEFDATFTDLATLAREPECIAIGETGLDYYWDRTTPTEQKQSLHAHLSLAEELDKPVIIHTRDAFADIFAELAEFPAVRGVLHCFSGGVEEARRGLDLGYYLSFAGPITYPKNDALRAAAAFAPADRVLIETDAPFLPPQPWRGKGNEPAYIVKTLDCLAHERGIDFAAAAELTMINGCQLFGIG